MSPDPANRTSASARLATAQAAYDREVAAAAARLREEEEAEHRRQVEAAELLDEGDTDKLAWRYAHERAERKAERYRRLLTSGRWTETQIAEVLGVSRQAVAKVAARYDGGEP